MERWFLENGEVAQYVAFFALLFLLAVFELLLPHRPRTPELRARWTVNFALTFLNVLVLGALPLSFLTAARWAEARELGLLRQVELPLFALIALHLLARGFISWLTHLLMHKVPLFWRVHRVHHLDTELDVSTTVRFHPVEWIIALAVGLPFVLVFGLSPWLLLVYELLDVAVTLWSHTNVRSPQKLERVLRLIVVTPELHRVHHSTIPEETDSNFSAVFPIFDLVFGTYRTKTSVETATMPLGLAEVRDRRSRSLPWLLVAPVLSLDRR